MTTKPKTNWEKRFDKKFTEINKEQYPIGAHGEFLRNERVKQFIQKELDKQKEEIFKELNENVPEEKCCKVCDIITNEATGVRLPLKTYDPED